MHRGYGKFLEGVFAELKLRVRQLAWLHAVPKAPSSPTLANQRAAPKSRMQELREKGGWPVLPDVTCAYLMEILLEVGPTVSTGMGRARITQAEIAKWQQNMRTPLAPWECRHLLRLSEAWLEQASVSEDPKCPPPYAEAPTTQTRAHVADMIDRLL